jgi:hypothetical protein
MTLPRRFDWRNVDGKDWTTDPRDQGNTEACVAFGIVAALESLLKIHFPKHYVNPDLSEAYLWACGHGGSASLGQQWTVGPALQYLKNGNGLPDEECFRWNSSWGSATTLSCEDRCPDYVPRIVGHTAIIDFAELSTGGDITLVAKDSLINNGPLVATRASDSHCLAVVGYDDGLDGGVWICKDSKDGGHINNVSYNNINNFWKLWVRLNPRITLEIKGPTDMTITAQWEEIVNADDYDVEVCRYEDGTRLETQPSKRPHVKMNNLVSMEIDAAGLMGLNEVKIRIRAKKSSETTYGGWSEFVGMVLLTPIATIRRVENGKDSIFIEVVLDGVDDFEAQIYDGENQINLDSRDISKYLLGMGLCNPVRWDGQGHYYEGSWLIDRDIETFRPQGLRNIGILLRISASGLTVNNTYKIKVRAKDDHFKGPFKETQLIWQPASQDPTWDPDPIPISPPGTWNPTVLNAYIGAGRIIVAKHSGKCLDIKGASKLDAAEVIQYHWHGGSNQMFKIESLPDDPGYYRIVATHSGKCLDIKGASKLDAAEVIQYHWRGGSNQMFRIEPLSDDPGYYRIVAKHSGKCLDIRGASNLDVAEVIQYHWHGGNNQRFRLSPCLPPTV